MGVWSFLRGERRRGAADEGAAALAALAEDICRELRDLGLFVDCRAYGGAFFEIRASSSRRMIATPGGREASGVALLLAGKFDPPALVFEQINSLRPGLGRRMVGAAMAGLRSRPGVLTRVKVNDLSPRQKDGRRWWEHVAETHADFEWRITHDADATHWPKPEPPSPSGLDAASSAEFARKRRRIEALAREFGHDPASVTLSPERKTFDYLGQSFASEGEATPDGRVTIYFDPEMSDARLGCCLAHEFQHVRYFAVREAHNAEPGDGPLHRRFAGFSPELLAARRGVSNYSNEHWDAWTGVSPPRLFSDELAEGGSEPINETIAEVAKALYNWGPEARVDPVWRELREAIDAEYRRLERQGRRAGAA